MHAFAERIGRSTTPIVATDQKRAWIHFLRSIETILPCPRCKAHYQDWRKRCPIDYDQTPNGEWLRAWAREWVWGLHTEINKEKDIESPTLEEVQNRFQDISKDDLYNDTKILLTHLLNSSQIRLIKPDALHVFRTHLTLLFRLT